MQKEYVFRYVLEGTVKMDGVQSDAHGLSLLKTELACGNIPAQRFQLEVLSDRTLPEKEAC